MVYFYGYLYNNICMCFWKCSSFFYFYRYRVSLYIHKYVYSYYMLIILECFAAALQSIFLLVLHACYKHGVLSIWGIYRHTYQIELYIVLFLRTITHTHMIFIQTYVHAVDYKKFWTCQFNWKTADRLFLEVFFFVMRVCDGVLIV